MNIMDIDRICSAISSERSFNIMTNKGKVTNIWDLPTKYKPCRKKQYDAYVCMPPKGTVVIDKFVQHNAYRMMNGQALFTAEQCSKNTMIAQRITQLMSQGQVSVVTEQEPFVVAGASGEFYTCSAQSLQKKFYFLVNNLPVQINEQTLVQRMKNGVLDWNVVRFIPNSAELLMACHVPTAYKGQIQTWMGIMTINDPSLQHGRGDFVVAKADAMGVPSNTMRFVVNGVAFADTYDICGWDDCVGSGSKARININTLPRII